MLLLSQISLDIEKWAENMNNFCQLGYVLWWFKITLPCSVYSWKVAVWCKHAGK
jgi:tellurite resistance protein TehA-like permease